MSLFNTNVMHIFLFVTFLMIVYLYIAGAYFICLLHNPQNISSKKNSRLIHHFLKKKSVAVLQAFKIRFFESLGVHFENNAHFFVFECLFSR